MKVLKPLNPLDKMLSKRKRHGPSEEQLAAQRKAATPRARREMSDAVRSVQQNFMGAPNRRDIAARHRAAGVATPGPTTPAGRRIPAKPAAPEAVTPMPKLPIRRGKFPVKPPALEARPMPKPKPRRRAPGGY